MRRSGAWTIAGTLLGLAEAPTRGAEAEVPLGDEIVVTGTRLKQNADAAFSPAKTFTVETLLGATPGGVADALNKLPQFQLSSSPSRSTHNFASSASHGNILNLRGVGGIRTLVLLDGLRVAPTTYRGEVDIDVLPSLLVERVDVVTNGASAIYGSDAVAGAVSFVLNRQFSGVRGLVQTGVSQRGDNSNARVGLAAGTGLWGGRAHLIVAAEANRNQGMRRDARDAGRQGLVFAGATGVGPPGSATNPFAIRADARLTTASDFGKIIGPADNPLAGFRFGADGSLAPFDAGTPTGTPGFAIGGDGFIIPATSTAIAATRTAKAFARLSVDVLPTLTVFAQASVAQRDENYTSLANSFLDPTPARLFSGNPYLPAAVQATLATPDASISLARYGGTDPQPATDERTRQLMATVGAEGRLGNATRWQAAYTLSRSVHDVAQANLWDWQRTYAAIDAVRDAGGSIVCRAALDPDPAISARFAGCRPLNLLVGGDAFTSQPGYGYAVGTSRYRAAVAQDAVAVQLNSTPFRFAGRGVDLAIGAEYRRQTLDLASNADPARLQTASDRAAHFAGLRGVAPPALFYWLTNVGTAKGAVAVAETFGEIAVPLSGTLRVSGAGRLTHYSTSGTEVTWKAAVQWQPLSAVQLRAGLSRDSRAPSMFELYAGPQSGIGLLVDPRSGETGNVISTSGGNPALQPERSHSFGVGAAIQPGWAPGFRLSLDYFRLKIDGQIDSLNITQIAQNCFSSGGTATECALIDQPDPTRLPTRIRTVPVNIAFLDTAGIDLAATWRGNAGGGNLVVQLHSTYLDRFRTRQGTQRPTLEFAGFGQSANQPVGRPRLQANLNIDFSHGNFGLVIAQQYLSGLTIGSQEPNQNFGGRKVGPIGYTDLSLRQRLPGCRCGAELFLTINNLFDRSPPIVPGTTPGLNFPTIISVYDVIGRASTLGVRIRL